MVENSYLFEFSQFKLFNGNNLFLLTFNLLTRWCIPVLSCSLFSRSVLSTSLQPHGLQHTRLPCPWPSPEFAHTHVHWIGDAIQPSHPLSSSCLLSFPASGSFLRSQLFASGGQSIGASASVLSRNIQGWVPLELPGLISLQSKGLSRVFSNTTVWEYQFFGAQPSLWSNSRIRTWLLEKP